MSVPAVPFIPGSISTSKCQVTLALAAGDMVLDGDRGSPQPYPKDLIGSWVEKATDLMIDSRCWLCNLGCNLKRFVESKIVWRP